MKLPEEQNKNTIPERLLIWFKGRKTYFSKEELSGIIYREASSFSSAFSKLRDQRYEILMKWSREKQCWIYNIV